MKKAIIFLIIIILVGAGAWYFSQQHRKGSTSTYTQAGNQTAQTTNQTPMQITSPAFAEGQGIPKKYSCDGDGVNPPLEFKDVPQNAQSLAFVMDDPDAPNGTWTHWTMWNINPTTTSIPENSVPTEAIEGKTSSGQNNYGGPCPPNGLHHYYFKLYALNTKLSIPERSTIDDMANAISGHIIEQAQLMGTYSR